MLLNLKAKENGHLIKTITSLKHISKQRKQNLNNSEIPLTMKNTNTAAKRERFALKVLSDHKYIIINKANKGEAVVIMDIKDYINATHPQLNSKDHYKILNKDPTETNAKLVNDTIQRKITQRKNCR